MRFVRRKNLLVYPFLARGRKILFCLLALAFLSLFGCDRGSSGGGGIVGPPGLIPINAVLLETDTLPGLNLAITRITGGTGPGGAFRVGDFISATFTVKLDDGTPAPLSELDHGAIMVSGPTFNYQRILAAQQDLRVSSILNPDNTWTYTFKTPIPSTYLAPINDTPSLGRADSELQGLLLFSGTYTVGIEVYKTYTVGNKTINDVASVTGDFLFGSATTLESRELVLLSNCNQCHLRLEAHNGTRQNLKLCLLCHTAGAEDNNDPAIEGGTPKTSIEFRVMIHKIHNGSHLPSVNGVSVFADGSRNYGATPKAYKLVSADGTVHDYSGTEFPVWPSKSYPMPKDQGYSTLTTSQQAQEDIIRKGVTACDKCHGNSANGAEAYRIISRNACGACHDDINWDFPYTSNGQTMPPQPKSYACQPCHPESGVPLAVRDAHSHPLSQQAYQPNLTVNFTALAEAGTNNGNSKIDSGEKISLTFSLKDDAASDVKPSELGELYATINGPTTNRNFLHYTSIPLGDFTTAQSSYTVILPQKKFLVYTGATWSNGVSNETAGPGTNIITPLWNSSGTGSTTTGLYQIMSNGSGSSTVSGTNSAGQNYLQVTNAAGFTDKNYVVVNSGNSTEEYFRIGYVDATQNRLWLASLYSTSEKAVLSFTHINLETVAEVNLQKFTEAVDYTIDRTTGVITETGDTTITGKVLLTYYTDFIVPTTYPLSLNDSSDFDETWAKWAGKTLVAGTYTAGLWGYRSFSILINGETNSYQASSPGATKDFLVGSATTLVTNDIISSGDNCKTCHDKVMFHNQAYQGYATCLLCHGGSGNEDRPLYSQTTPDPANKATVGVTIDFRTLLHKIHRGKDLAKASTYQVIGEGDVVRTYKGTSFPANPGKAKHCTACHGPSSTTWEEPTSRIHPTQQTQPAREWRAVCSACHDSDSTSAHIDLMTPSGNETCSICHGKNRSENIALRHKTR